MCDGYTVPHSLCQYAAFAYAAGHSTGMGSLLASVGPEGDVKRVGAAADEQRNDASFVDRPEHLIELLHRLHILIVEGEYHVTAPHACARSRPLRVLDEHTACYLELLALPPGEIR